MSDPSTTTPFKTPRKQPALKTGRRTEDEMKQFYVWLTENEFKVDRGFLPHLVKIMGMEDVGGYSKKDFQKEPKAGLKRVPPFFFSSFLFLFFFFFFRKKNDRLIYFFFFSFFLFPANLWKTLFRVLPWSTRASCFTFIFSTIITRTAFISNSRSGRDRQGFKQHQFLLWFRAANLFFLNPTTTTSSWVHHCL